MRPTSIIWFERLYLGAIMLGLVNLFVSWESTMEIMRADPNAAAFGEGGLAGMMIGIFAVSFMITLILWYFAARRASTVAKWIVVVFFVIGLLSLPNAIAIGQFRGLQGLLLTIAWIMNATAIFMLFRPDAAQWFKGEWQSPEIAETFE